MIGEDLITGSVVAAVVAGVVSLVVVSIRDKHSKNELYAKTVSSFRMEWIKDIRKYLVKLIVLCKKMHRTEEDRTGFERCRANILMRLSPNSDSDKQLKDLLGELEIMGFGQICGTGNSIAEKIENLGTELLKNEWERVKVEAGETIKKREEIILRIEEIKQYKKIGSFD